jgi:PAS domain S-box-containing protein
MALPDKNALIRRSISRDILRRIFFTCMIVTLLFTGVEGYMEYQHELASIHDRIAEIEKTQLKIMATALWQFDENELSALVSGILHYPYIRHVGIRNRNDTSILTEGTRLEKGAISKQFPLYYESGGEQIHLGTLFLQADTSGMRGNVATRAILRMLIVTGMVVIIATVISFIFKRRLLSYVIDIADNLQKTSIPDANNRLDIAKKDVGDEIDLLVSSFNSMKDNIRSLLAEKNEALIALTESEKRFRNLIEQAPEAIVTYDAKQDRLIDVNPAAEMFFGYSREVLLEGDAHPLHPSDRPDVRPITGLMAENHQRVSTGETVKTQCRLHTGDGRSRIFDVQLVGLPSAQGNLIRGTFIDITERRKTEKELQSTNAIFSSFLKHSPIYSYIKELFPGKSVVLRASDNYEQMLRMTADEMIGKSMDDLFPAELAARMTNDDWAVVNAGKVLTVEERLNNREYTSIKFPIIFKDRKLLAGYTIDITDRRKLEASLQRAEKMEALGLLAGGVAHDLNNTLGAFIGYAELLHDDLEDSDPRKADARKIVEGGERAAAIVQDLLTLARRGVQTKGIVNLNKIVTEYVRSAEKLKMASLHPHVRIRTELEESLLLISGSQVHLSKTLMNLVSNAAEAMASGGEILIRTENRYVDRPVSGYDRLEEGDYVVLTVADEGEGISDQDIKHIFEPFYTKKTMGRSGTGLGLSVVWGTVKDHSGYIDVQSRKNRGTTFQLYFPVTRERETGEKALTTSESLSGRGERILVVDDIAEQRDLARRILEKLMYRVETVSSGEEALAHLRDREADLVILDMIMEPGIDGFETYRRILEIRPHQRAIIVSGFAETDRVAMTQALGAGEFVKKPYIKERIGLAVRKELDGK